MSHIVLTTDLSDESKRAFAPTAALARQLGLRLVLLSVLERMPFEPAGAGLVAHYPDPEHLRRDQERELERLAAGIGKDLVARTVVLDAADVVTAICDFAHREGASYIAMATHGRSGLRRLLLGSVAEAVLRHARVPVLVFPPPA